MMCCVGNERRDENAQLKREAQQLRLDMKSVVNILPEVATDKERKAFIDLCANEDEANVKTKIENKGIRKEQESQFPGDHRDYEKLDLKVELLLHHLRTDLQTLQSRYPKLSLDNPPTEFAKELLVLIGANTREISKLVIRAYLYRRMQALFRLKTADCKVGPKLEAPSTPCSSKSKQGMSEQQERASRKQEPPSQSKNWLDCRLNYRRLVFKMIKEIETHCEDVICLA